jgi:hypothetical protein
MLLDIFLQQNGTYFLNKSRNTVLGGIVPVGKVWPPLGPGLEGRRMSVMASYPGTGCFFMKGCYLRYNLHIILPTVVSFSMGKNLLVSIFYQCVCRIPV